MYLLTMYMYTKWYVTNTMSKRTNVTFIALQKYWLVSDYLHVDRLQHYLHITFEIATCTKL